MAKKVVSDIVSLMQGRYGFAAPAFKAFVGEDKTGLQAPSLETFEKEYLADYTPHEHQKTLHKEINRRFVAICAGRRAGKTYGTAREFLRRVYRDVERKKANGGKWTPPSGKLGNDTKPFVHYYCTSPTYALGNLQRRELLEILGGENGSLVLRYHQSAGYMWLRGGVLIEFKSGDRSKRLVGAGLDGLWDDESARQKEDLWDESLRPALSDRGGWALFSSTPLGKNWFHEKIWEKTQFGSGTRDNDYLGIRFLTADNTSIPGLVEEAAKAKRELPRAVYLRNYEASFDAFEGKIFESFVDDETHVLSSLPRIVTRWAGADWGYSNPGTLICVGLDLFDNVIVWNEDYVKGLTISSPPNDPDADSWVKRFEKAIRKDVDHIWADPSQPVNIETANQAGIKVYPADNDVNAGIDFLLTLFQPSKGRGRGEVLRPSIYLHESCVNLRRELSSYRWGANSQPVKENDHAIDALRYAVFSEVRKGNLMRRRIEETQLNFPSVFDS